MISSNTYLSNALQIDKDESAIGITLTFRGKTGDRDPSAFLAPILDEVITQSRSGEKEIVLDFTALRIFET